LELENAQRQLASWNRQLTTERARAEEAETELSELRDAMADVRGRELAEVTTRTKEAERLAKHHRLVSEARLRCIAEYKASEADWREQLRAANARAARLDGLTRELGSEHEKLMAIAKLAWAIRTGADGETAGQLDDALECFDDLYRSHLARIVKPYPYGEPPLSAAPQASTEQVERTPVCECAGGKCVLPGFACPKCRHGIGCPVHYKGVCGTKPIATSPVPQVAQASAGPYLLESPAGVFLHRAWHHHEVSREKRSISDGRDLTQDDHAFIELWHAVRVLADRLEGK
jgi:hypothetical protein